jgi:hypothetical protein
MHNSHEDKNHKAHKDKYHILIIMKIQTTSSS